MPEQKDFASWRRKLGELEEGARDGTYEENWQLPSGKIFRVTGRPHPQGALAFLFEDISTAIMLERKYRSELELSQATLDRMSEAVAVFDASGTLVFVNSAFEALWGLDPMERLDGPGVAAMAAFWAERCAPSDAWARLTEFTTAAEARTSWTETIATRDGRAVEMLVAPLPDASALVVFRDRDSAGEAGPQALAATLAAEALREPLEALLPRLAAALPGGADPRDASRRSAAACRRCSEGLARARGARRPGARPATATAPTALAPLAAALAARGHRARRSTRPTPRAGMRRSAARAIALGLAAADVGGADGADHRGLRRRRGRAAADRQRGHRARRSDGRRRSASRSPAASSRPPAAKLRVVEAGGVLILTAECPTGPPRAPTALRA